MDTLNPDVPDDVFADILKQVNQFVRTRVIPRELEIMNTDTIPRICGPRWRRWVCSVTRYRRSGAAWDST
jgi:hypothetical protein